MTPAYHKTSRKYKIFDPQIENVFLDQALNSRAAARGHLENAVVVDLPVTDFL